MAEEKARDPTTPENKPVSIPLSKIHDLPGSVFAPPSQKSLEALTRSIVLKRRTGAGYPAAARGWRVSDRFRQPPPQSQ